MAGIRVINQPLDGQLGDILCNLLEESQTGSVFYAFVAFAKNSGVLRLKQSLESFKKNEGEINVFVGVDLGGTSYEALTTLHALADKLFIAHAESNQTFHPKVYSFHSSENTTLIIGSNNMTAGGLWTNFEACAIIDIDSQSTSDSRLTSTANQFAKSLVSQQGLVRQISSQADIDALLQDGYVEKEAITKIRIRRTERESSAQMPLGPGQFAYGVYAPLPAIRQNDARLIPDEKPVNPPHIAQVGNPEEEADQIMWFETRSMTGGSRNILDLSKTALVMKETSKDNVFHAQQDGTMPGGVRFFGVNPLDETAEKDIVINYQGIDYVGNTIKYPTGSKANGTWRLQIKGVSNTGQRITAALGKGYLVQKIIAFAKVRDDYYFMTVYEGNELDRFEKASTIVAYNGGNQQSRLMGLL